MENAEIARVLAEIADLLELTGGNEFKVRAYRRAAQVVDLHPGPIAELWRTGGVGELPGVGAHIAEKIGELVETGECREHARLSALVPGGVLEMLRLEGVGPKTVEAVWRKLGIQDLAGLEEACRSGRVLEAARMGPTRASAILAALERHRARAGRMLLHRALGHAEPMLERLRAVPGVLRAEVAGSVRRRKETVGDIDLLVAATDAEPVVRAVTQLAGVSSVLAEGPTKASVRLRAGIQADLRVLPPESFGAALIYFTGSKTHNIALRTRALKRGLKISEYGVFDRAGHRLGGATEEEVFRAVGLPFIAPELREGTDLSDVGCRAAKAAGVPVVISTDAHVATHLANLRYGVWVARRGWLEAKDVLNTLPLAELRRRLARRGAPA